MRGLGPNWAVAAQKTYTCPPIC